MALSQRKAERIAGSRPCQQSNRERSRLESARGSLASKETIRCAAENMRNNISHGTSG